MCVVIAHQPAPDAANPSRTLTEGTHYVVMAVGLILANKVCGRARHVAIGYGIVFACLIAGEVFGFVFQFLGG